MTINFNRIAIVADVASKTASEAYDKLSSMYQFAPERAITEGEVDVVVAIGGDGLMLKVLHRYLDQMVLFYGLNAGTVGFLLNPMNMDNLLERINSAQVFNLNPLQMKVTDTDDQVTTKLAINEISILRETNQAARLQVLVDEQERLERLVCDGVLVSTPAGSTAYNYAANGPIIPFTGNLLAMTPIAPFRPRRWHGALIPNHHKISIVNTDPYKRPISAVADFHEIREAVRVDIETLHNRPIRLLFDQGNSIEDKIMREMFIS